MTKRVPSTHVPTNAARRRAFRENLLAWYDANRRNMPWRNTSDPYRIWLSEVMLQQTRVDQAEPYYRRFAARFPTVERLAAASLDDVLACWEGLGYYSRARNLHKAARRIVETFGGRLPDEEEAIRSLPGVGPYTAAAVLSIAYGKALPALDGNAIRVLARVFRVAEDATRAGTRNQLRDLAADLMDSARPGAFNQAVMELGANVCKPAAPRCEACPLRPVCAAAEAGDQTAFPVTPPRKKTPHFDVAVAIVFDDAGRLLVCKRPEEAMLGGLWEFPGGKRKPGETLEAACRRAVRKKWNVDVETRGLARRIDHAYTHFRITMHAFRASIAAGAPRAPADRAFMWADRAELQTLAFSRTGRLLVEFLSLEQAQKSGE